MGGIYSTHGGKLLEILLQKQYERNISRFRAFFKHVGYVALASNAKCKNDELDRTWFI